MGLADRDYPKDLYELLRVGRHISAEELRYAYEQAMSAATRCGDMVRARTLLSAYEALSRPRRDSVFGRTFGGPGPIATPPPPAPRSARRTARKRAPRPRKWGMSLPIRVLFYIVVVPAVVFVSVGGALHLTQAAQHSTPAGVLAQPSQVNVAPLQRVTAADAALYVERLNERDDVTCAPAGAEGETDQFSCQASDGASWAVHGSSPESLTAVVTSPSTYLQSARFDAQVAVSAVEQCRKAGGALPEAVGPQSIQAVLVCGRGTLTLYLRPGDSLEYARTGTGAYRLTVVAANGERVTYNSRTKRYE